MMNHHRFVLFGTIGVIALVIGFTVSGLSTNLTYYLYPTEAISQKADFPDGSAFRLAGNVVAGSVNVTADVVTFEVTDGGATIAILLNGPPPSLFGDDVPVLLEGSWSGDTFVASEALIKHDENYQTPEKGGAYPDN